MPGDLGQSRRERTEKAQETAGGPVLRMPAENIRPFCPSLPIYQDSLDRTFSVNYPFSSHSCLKLVSAEIAFGGSIYFFILCSWMTLVTVQMWTEWQVQSAFHKSYFSLEDGEYFLHYEKQHQHHFISSTASCSLPYHGFLAIFHNGIYALHYENIF